MVQSWKPAGNRLKSILGVFTYPFHSWTTPKCIVALIKDFKYVICLTIVNPVTTSAPAHSQKSFIPFQVGETPSIKTKICLRKGWRVRNIQ